MKKRYFALIGVGTMIAIMGIGYVAIYNYSGIAPCGSIFSLECANLFDELPIILDYREKYSDYEDSLDYYKEPDGTVKITGKVGNRTATMAMKFWNGEPVFVRYLCSEKQVRLFDQNFLPEVNCFDYQK